MAKKKEIVEIPFRKKATRDFTGENLKGSDMRDTDYIECNFTKADLQGCMFDGSTFKDCIFSETDVRWASGFPKDIEGVIWH
jgi:uncharacterized protein YjbI with pentapeptide repeats